MGWPKGKPRISGGGRRKEIDLETLIEDGGKEPEQVDQQEEEQSNVVLIDSEGIYGVRTYKFGYELYVRRKYKKDTIVETKGISSEIKTVVYKAGDYGPWQIAAKPYHKTMDSVLLTTFHHMIKDGISESSNISNLRQIIKDSEDRITQYWKT